MGLIFAHQKDANAGKGETEEVKVLRTPGCCGRKILAELVPPTILGRWNILPRLVAVVVAIPFQAFHETSHFFCPPSSLAPHVLKPQRRRPTSPTPPWPFVARVVATDCGRATSLKGAEDPNVRGAQLGGRIGKDWWEAWVRKDGWGLCCWDFFWGSFWVKCFGVPPKLCIFFLDI